MTQSDESLETEFLAHWCRLSQVQKRALLALSSEIMIACDLVEESVEALTARFLGLADSAKCLAVELGKFDFVAPETLQHQLTPVMTALDKGGADPDTVAFIEDLMRRQEANRRQQQNMIGEAERVAKGFEEIVSLLQFQDRTSQRLTVISDALQSVAALVVKMHDETLEKIVLTQQDQAEDRWIEELVSAIHLGEIRERFIKHALFDKCPTLFAQAVTEPQNAADDEGADDIELF